ncbi:CARDB domain-containing protein [Halomicrococcus sp. SG-WS-1]|uniref:CARDB domain-containing protein n=1 Tax=Halomicrococcus sp. SG-WS-1 TaxID=3439057 RepID=UPI003F7ADD0D
MSDDRVVAFRDAVGSGDTATAIDRFDDFDEALNDRQARESAVRDVARRILARSSQNPESAEAAKRYLEAVAEAQQARLQAKYDFLLYLKDGPSGSDVADKVDSVVSANESVRERETSMRQNSGDIALPTAVQVTGPSVRTVPLGESLDIEYEVVNVGLRGVSEVAIDVEGFDATAESSAIDALPAGKETTVTVSGTPKTSDETALKVTVDDSTAQTRVVPLDKAEYVERVGTQFEETKSEVNDAASLSRRTIGNGNGESSRDPFSKDGLEVKLQANVENDRLTLREKVQAKESVQIRTTVNVHPAATPEQGATAYLAVATRVLELAERALEENRPSLADELLREYVSALQSASDALTDSSSGTGKSNGKGNETEGDYSPISQRQLAIWVQDLGEISDIAATALRAQA